MPDIVESVEEASSFCEELFHAPNGDIAYIYNAHMPIIEDQNRSLPRSRSVNLPTFLPHLPPHSFHYFDLAGSCSGAGDPARSHISHTLLSSCFHRQISDDTLEILICLRVSIWSMRWDRLSLSYSCMKSLVSLSYRYSHSLRECPSMPVGWLEEETCRTSGNQSGKIEKFYIDPTTGKKFRSILRAREHLDGTYGPRDWRVYDSGQMRQTRKGKKVVQAAIEPVIMIGDSVDEEAPAAAAATGSFGLTFLSDFMGKAVLVDSDGVLHM
ncbi:hypothetical protein Droror1_Dr00019742 [Drosera rotundifolia]